MNRPLQADDLKATFIQVSSDGSVGEGRLYFRRPHQLRLDYENPATLSIVTSKIWVYVDDKIDQFVQAIPVSETPFAPFYQKQSVFALEMLKFLPALSGIASVRLTNYW